LQNQKKELVDINRKKKSIQRERVQIDSDSSDDEEEYMDEVINCVCGVNKDLGYMISCERCLSWLHGKCVNISRRNEPSEYYCPNCVQILQNLQNSTSKIQKEYKNKKANSKDTPKKLERTRNK